ncbi:Glycerol-3-phosphate dehydrogenase [NAD(P)+] [bioreactor metagenome]|uniref:Glycerol-3-phosphate dehydrogenase [NAD(P)+] n=1 Tax=bioreactor metagenome TaxID=1076179 RepID=A0A644XXV4_9ZZZZ
MMKISVLGCGRWGAFQAWYAARCGHDVLMWGRPGEPDIEELISTRRNSYLELPSGLNLTTDLDAAVGHADLIIISISSQALRSFAARLDEYDLSRKPFLLCMKGLEQDTGKRLTTVMSESIKQPIRVAVLSGPGHVQSYTAGIPGAMVVDSEDKAHIKWIIDSLGSELIRLYIGNDLIGTEIGAAAKNVIGLAAGMLDGFGYTSLKGALMARGAREVARLIKAMGGNELSAYGLCHLGDYEATLFSEFSQNRMFGETFVKGETYTKLAEGVYTVKAMVKLSDELGVELPISRAVLNIVHHGADPKQELTGLFLRSVKSEFD